MVCEPGPDGPVVVQDDQWWDQVSWVVAAHRLAVAAADDDVLHAVEPIARRTVELALTRALDPDRGLVRGPAFMQDGISGYPRVLRDPASSSSFVLDHPRCTEVFALSTNLVTWRPCGAWGPWPPWPATRGWPRPTTPARTCWPGGSTRCSGGPDGTYAYLAEPITWDDRAALRMHPQQEAFGWAFAVLTGQVGLQRARFLVSRARREPAGIALVTPAFKGFDDDHPGRHNVMCWPVAMGAWVQAACRAGDVEAAWRDLDALLTLVEGSGLRFFELYDARTGAVDGGWQCDRRWASEPDQTWSAAALVGAVVHGVVGVRPAADGLRLSPALPAAVGPTRLDGLRYRAASLDVTLEGSGGAVEVRVDGRVVPVGHKVLAPDATGHHDVVIRCTPGGLP